jgi:hypothetical protein
MERRNKSATSSGRRPDGAERWASTIATISFGYNRRAIAMRWPTPTEPESPVTGGDAWISTGQAGWQG